MTDRDYIPIIDVAGLRSAHPADRSAVGSALRSASIRSGFFYVTNHGIPETLRETVLREAVRFFALPQEEKGKVDSSLSRCGRGYEPLRNQQLEHGAPPDVKEGFQIGVDLPPDHPRVIAGVFGQGPNLWPEGLPGWRETMEEYSAQMSGLAALMMRGMALSLDLTEDAFEGFCDEPTTMLRLLHYPPQPSNAKPREKGCGEHTDWGALTFLYQDDVGGLEIWNDQLGWLPATPIPGTYVVNIGDMMARWTNDRYHSTLHRVVNRSGRERYSIPFFYDGRPDHVVSCLSNCLEPGAHPKYPPITSAEQLAEMYRRTYTNAPESSAFAR